MRDREYQGEVLAGQIVVEPECRKALHRCFNGEEQEGVDRLRELAAGGSALAAGVLGDLHQNEPGLGDDAEALAAPWYEQAARAGDPTAARELARMVLRSGLEDPEAVEAGMTWLSVAAAGGDEQAMTLLGIAHEAGHGCLQDHARAGDWYARAADLGHVPAMTNLGRLFLWGSGVERDPKLAYFWLLLAVAGGDIEAMADRDQAVRWLSTEQAMRVQQVALRWQPKRQ